MIFAIVFAAIAGIGCTAAGIKSSNDASAQNRKTQLQEVIEQSRNNKINALSSWATAIRL